MNRQCVPDNFPRASAQGAVSGTQPKLLLRKAGDTYGAEPTDAEVYERYMVCEDLAQQFVTYTARKMTENTLSLQTAISKVEIGFLKKTRSGIWEFSDAEVTWTIGRIREILSDPASGRTSLAPDSNILNQAGEEKRDE